MTLGVVNTSSESAVVPRMSNAQAPTGMLGLAGGGSGMRAWNPARLLPKISTTSFAFIAAVGVGAGLLIQDAMRNQTWLNEIKDGFIYAGDKIGVFFTETVPALSSTAAIASYIGVAAFLASVINLGTFSEGLQQPYQSFEAQAIRGIKTISSGAAAGAGWGAMAGVLGAGAGALPGAALGAGIGAAFGVVEALLMLLKSGY